MGWCKYAIEDYKGAINELDTGINLENDVKDDTSKAFLFWLRAECKYELEEYESN